MTTSLTATRGPKRSAANVLGATAACCALLSIVTLAGCDAREVTFNRDIAPIVHQHCTPCHRAGDSAPFELVDYADVLERSREIGETTQNRYMPPWLPAPGHGTFRGERRLSSEQIDLIRRWIAQGTPEGDPDDLPTAPTFSDDWTLGEPDLVIQMPEPYLLAADGPDVYRNFVIPAPLARTRFVKAIDFRPGNKTVAHHAFVLVDGTRNSRRLAEEDPEPGYEGIHPSPSASNPDGFFLSWTPGRQAEWGIEGTAWRLEKGADVVIQLHMQPSGKPESIQSSIGLYFADGPPTRHALTFPVFSKALDIPAGEENYRVDASHKLPVDVDAIAILPHAHFLGKRMQAVATFPDGKRQDLILIERWDFNWQAAYSYAEPVFLPRGTEVALHYVYDNSSKNPFNPHLPPQRVTFGPESSDEMCELWLQVLPRSIADLATLKRDAARIMMQDVLDSAQRDLAQNAGDAEAHLRLGQALFGMGKTEQALKHYRSAAELDPESADAQLYLGLAYQKRGNSLLARQAFLRAIELRPDDAVLHNALGELHLREQRLADAAGSFLRAIEINPDYFIANLQLGVVRATQGRIDEAAQQFRLCLEIQPDSRDARKMLQRAESYQAGRQSR